MNEGKNGGPINPALAAQEEKIARLKSELYKSMERTNRQMNAKGAEGGAVAIDDHSPRASEETKAISALLMQEVEKRDQIITELKAAKAAVNNAPDSSTSTQNDATN